MDVAGIKARLKKSLPDNESKLYRKRENLMNYTQE
jgi:hypothetical protein